MQQILLIPIALSEGHYAALAMNRKSKQCVYLQTSNVEIPKAVKSFIRKMDLELNTSPFLPGAEPDRGPTFLAAAQQLLTTVVTLRNSFIIGSLFFTYYP